MEADAQILWFVAMLGKLRTLSMLADALSLTRVITPGLPASLDGSIFAKFR